VLWKAANKVNFSKYQDDPVGFGEEVLGDTYTDEVKQMMESVRDNVITVAKSSNATGKSHGAARIAVWWYKCFPHSEVYTAAAPPEDNLRKILWGEIGSIAEKHPELFGGDDQTNLNIERASKEFLTGVRIPSSGTPAQREAKFSGKHAPNLLFVIDEGDAVPDEVYRGIDSCMTGGHVRLLVMFNPRAPQGEVYRMIRDGRANVVPLSALNHPNVLTGEDVIPGAVTRETTVRRVNQWCRPLAEGEDVGTDCFELPKFLEGIVAKSQSGQPYPPLKPGYYKIMEPAFSYMVLGEYPAQSTTQLISREWTAKARGRYDFFTAKQGEKPIPGIPAVAGLDSAEFGADANCMIFRYGGFVEKPITWTGVDMYETGERSMREIKNRLVLGTNVDAIGVGAGVAPHLRRLNCNAQDVKTSMKPTETSEIGDFNKMRDQLWWMAREWLRLDPGAMLPPDEELLEELHCPTYEVKNGKICVMQKKDMREILGRSPDKGDALCLTFFEVDEEGFVDDRDPSEDLDEVDENTGY
jgi:hypothetical protein